MILQTVFTYLQCTVFFCSEYLFRTRLFFHFISVSCRREPCMYVVGKVLPDNLLLSSEHFLFSPHWRASASVGMRWLCDVKTHNAQPISTYHIFSNQRKTNQLSLVTLMASLTNNEFRTSRLEKVQYLIVQLKCLILLKGTSCIKLGTFSEKHGF